MFQIFIDDEEVKCSNQIEIEEEFMNPSSIILEKVCPKSWSVDDLLNKYYYPEDYTKCKILKDGELFFVGIVKNSADMELNPLKPHYCSLQILDPSVLLSDGTTLNYVISGKTVTEAINQVINSISDYGFVAGNIQIPTDYDTVIGAYSTLNKAPFDVLQYLSQISLTRWGTRMIDEDTTAIDFFSPELLDNLGTIEVTKKYCQSNHIESFTYDYSTTDYRNKQVVTSDEVYGSVEQKEIITADGYSTSFSTEQKIGTINSITVDGVAKTFTTQESGLTADFYYKVTGTSISSDLLLASGSSIQINYIPLVEGREISYNVTEINRIKEQIGRNGTISKYENRTDVTNSMELQIVGQNYIKYKGVAEITLTIKSRVDFLKLGGKYLFKAPIDKLNGSYLVKSKNVIIFQNPEIQYAVYEYKLTNSFDTENELNYFDNQRAKMSGNISEGDSISRNIDITSSMTIIFDSLMITEVEVQNTSALDAQLEAIL